MNGGVQTFSGSNFHWGLQCGYLVCFECILLAKSPVSHLCVNYELQINNQQLHMRHCGWHTLISLASLRCWFFMKKWVIKSFERQLSIICRFLWSRASAIPSLQTLPWTVWKIVFIQTVFHHFCFMFVVVGIGPKIETATPTCQRSNRPRNFTPTLLNDWLFTVPTAFFVLYIISETFQIHCCAFLTTITFKFYTSKLVTFQKYHTLKEN